MPCHDTSEEEGTSTSHRSRSLQPSAPTSESVSATGQQCSAKSGKRKARPRSSPASSDSIICFELDSSPANDVLDHRHYGSARGTTLPPQGCPRLLHQGHHDHHRRRSFRLDHPKHPHQAEPWCYGRLHQVWWHHRRLRYAPVSGLTDTTELMSYPGAMGAAYEFTRCASANLRQRDDAWNSFWGGLAGGSMLGLRCTNYDPN